MVNSAEFVTLNKAYLVVNRGTFHHKNCACFFYLWSVAVKNVHLCTSTLYNKGRDVTWIWSIYPWIPMLTRSTHILVGTYRTFCGAVGGFMSGSACWAVISNMNGETVSVVLLVVSLQNMLTWWTDVTRALRLVINFFIHEHFPARGSDNT